MKMCDPTLCRIAPGHDPTLWHIAQDKIAFGPVLYDLKEQSITKFVHRGFSLHYTYQVKFKK
jgi:hypothetical protein